MEKLDLRLPTEEDAKKKVKDFHEARNFEFTDDLVDTVCSKSLVVLCNIIFYEMLLSDCQREVKI